MAIDDPSTIGTGSFPIWNPRKEGEVEWDREAEVHKAMIAVGAFLSEEMNKASVTGDDKRPFGIHCLITERSIRRLLAQDTDHSKYPYDDLNSTVKLILEGRIAALESASGSLDGFYVYEDYETISAKTEDIVKLVGNLRQFHNEILVGDTTEAYAGSDPSTMKRASLGRMSDRLTGARLACDRLLYKAYASWSNTMDYTQTGWSLPLPASFTEQGATPSAGTLASREKIKQAGYYEALRDTESILQELQEKSSRFGAQQALSDLSTALEALRKVHADQLRSAFDASGTGKDFVRQPTDEELYTGSFAWIYPPGSEAWTTLWPLELNTELTGVQTSGESVDLTIRGKNNPTA